MHTPDLVIRNGLVGSAAGSVVADVAIAGETIVAVGRGLPPGKVEIDATGKIVVPGGIDSHTHIEQVSAGGLMNADTWESATRSAAFGGTTSVIAFAAQHVGLDLAEVVADYEARAARGAVIDYAFHMIVADPTEAALAQLPGLIEKGHSSIKAFMTYDRIRLSDEQLLDVMAVAKDKGAMVCVHAENHGMISWTVKRLLATGHTAPKHHALSHPRLSETEAFERLIRFSLLLDQPVMIFHVSTAEGAAVIRRWRGEGAKVFAETCPQYLFLSAADLDRPGLEGAKWMCSPPPRAEADQEALWRALALGDLQTVSSDHAPYRFDETGKLAHGPDSTFKQMANGLPGLEARLPLLFDAMVSKGLADLDAFVALTATNPARIYNLPNKGALLPGYDADVAIWDPAAEVTFSDETVRDGTGYTPYAGRIVRGWPTTVIRRGAVIVEGGRMAAEAGSGRLMLRAGGPAAQGTGRREPELDPARGGAALI